MTHSDDGWDAVEAAVRMGAAPDVVRAKRGSAFVLRLAGVALAKLTRVGPVVSVSYRVSRAHPRIASNAYSLTLDPPEYAKQLLVVGEGAWLADAVTRVLWIVCVKVCSERESPLSLYRSLAGRWCSSACFPLPPAGDPAYPRLERLAAPDSPLPPLVRVGGKGKRRKEVTASREQRGRTRGTAARTAP